MFIKDITERLWKESAVDKADRCLELWNKDGLGLIP